MKYFVAILLFNLFFPSGFAQVNDIILSPKKSEAKLISNNQTKIKFHFNNDKLSWKNHINKNGEEFTELWIKGGYSIGHIGEPKLPAYKKLIRIPAGAKVSVKVVNYNQQEISLKTKGVLKPVIPLQPSLRKDQEEVDVKFEIRKEIYEKDAYQQLPIATIEVLGTMRSQTIARLIVAPVDYNPVKGSIIVYNDLDVEVNLQDADQSTQDYNDQKTFSPYFEFVYKSLFNATNSTYDNHPDLTKYPVKMLIISNRMFEQTLQPFIEWKKLKGFNVIVAYTDVIGSTADQIKTFIQQQYSSATPDDPAPSFLVLVGDVDQVAASATGSATGRKTDLYYASVDGDMFPDMYYGRLSATNTTQLANIISKILYYEKYQFADPTYLNQVTLIAGNDAEWNYKVGQPTVKYGTANYFNTSKGFSSVNEYGVTSDPNNPSAISGYTGCYTNDKISVAMVNYTAHCSETAWSDPALSISAVNGFSNLNKYPLAIGNCCLSGDFGYSECIGETWIRGQNKGAVTYIGSSPSTYWLEDFYWSVGAFPMVGENNGYVPTFGETTTGMYDAPFVSKYTTTGAMVFAGNLAVTEVDVMNYESQSSPLYYWQAYNILGDPSLMPYFTEAERNNVTHNDYIPLGESVFKVNTLQGSYITLSKDNQIVGSIYANQTGEIDVPVIPITQEGEVVVAITRPQTISYFDTINAITPTGPYLILNNYSINDNLFNNNSKADFNETFTTNLSIKNLGTEPATNVKIIISGTDDYINFTGEDTIAIPNIPSGEGLNIVDVLNTFTFTVRENIPDQHVAIFYLKFLSNQGNWTSKLKITLNSPEISIIGIAIDDSKLGDNNGKFNLGESCFASVQIKNTGHSDISGLTCEISVPDSLKDFISVSFEPINEFSIITGETHSVAFRITSSPVFSGYNELPIIVKINSLSPTKISQFYSKPVTIIPDNVVIMSNTIVNTCYSTFYDSGGETGDYSNLENITKSFFTNNEYSKLKVKFNTFSLENSWDFLYIYDGPDIKSAQISGSPFTGSNIPPEIISSGNALTFRFTSDGNTTKPGWSAIIACYSPQAIPPCAFNPNPANGATGVSQSLVSWNSVADAQFYDVYMGYDPVNLAMIGQVRQNFMNVNLQKFQTYYWRIFPGNYLGVCQSGCETWQFTTDTITDQVIMSNNVVEVDTAYFFDSGGPLQSYKNNENYTLTVKPKIKGTHLVADFREFLVESHTTCGYDKLTIYDGLTDTAPILGYYCGTTIPPLLAATNSDGALTFKFHSDESETRAGWKAILRSVGDVTLFPLSFHITDSKGPIGDASIIINDKVKFSNDYGNVSYAVPNGDVIYKILASGYEIIVDTVTISSSGQTININLKKTNPVNISIYNATSGNPVHGVKVQSGLDCLYSNPNGLVKFYKPEGTSHFVFTLTGYDTLKTNLSIPDTESDHNISFSPSHYPVSITVIGVDGSKLGNASLTINNETFLSDQDGMINIELPFNTFGFSVSKVGFIPYFDWIKVNENAKKTVILEPLSSLIKIGFFVYGAGPKDTFLLANSEISIFINDIIYLTQKTGEAGNDSLRLPKGLIKYSLTKEGYNPKNNIPFIVGELTNRIADTLNQITYKVEFKVTSNSSEIKDASVNISGYKPIVTDLFGSAIFNQVGWEKGLDYLVTRDGYHDFQGIIDATSDLFITVNLTLLSTPAIAENGIRLYPNPASKYIIIKSENEISQIEIFDITGVSRYSSTNNQSHEISVSIENLPGGVYFIKVIFTNSLLYISRFIKS